MFAMKISARARTAFAPGMAAVLAGLLIASCASPPPPAPLPPPPIPPAAPPPPPVAFPKALVAAAGAYRAYIRRASAISPAFANGQAVEQSLVVAAAYEPKQFLKGMIAYAALVALQDSNFVAGVRTYGVDPV